MPLFSLKMFTHGKNFENGLNDSKQSQKYMENILQESEDNIKW